MSLILISSVFAVSRDTSIASKITYGKSVAMPNSGAGLLKGYWAVEDIVSGCTFNSVSCGSSSYYACIKSGSTIRIVAHSDDSGQNLPSSVQVTVGGTGTCALSMYHVESWKTSAATVTGSSTGPLAGSLSFGGVCYTEADTNCNNVVSDQELLAYASLWLSGSKTDSQLLQAAQAWLSG